MSEWTLSKLLDDKARILKRGRGRQRRGRREREGEREGGRVEGRRAGGMEECDRLVVILFLFV